jgi:SAM-dependent methyltransferase
MTTTLEHSRGPKYGASDHYIGERGKEYFAWQSGGGALAAQIQSHTFAQYVKHDNTVIDFGCGGGFLLAHLDCKRRYGVEINAIARQHAQSLGVHCVADAAALQDEIADVILTNHALEHVPYPIGALSTLRNKLRTEGLLIVCVPMESWRIHRKYDPSDSNHHLHTWTPQLLGNTLYEAGFEVVSVSGRVVAWPGRWTVACYGRLPYFLFRIICWCYGKLSGKGHEVLAVARRRK